MDIIQTKPKQKITNRNNSILNNSTFTTNQSDSALGNELTHESFIRMALAQIQADNMFDDESIRPMIMQSYYDIAGMLKSYCHPRESIVTRPIHKSSTLGEGWYVMPNDWVSWISTPSAMQYAYDAVGQWCVNFGTYSGLAASTADNCNLYEGQMSITYVSKSFDINKVDQLFRNALKWCFLKEWGSSQNSISQNITAITAEADKALMRYKTEAYKTNRRLSGWGRF